MQGQTKLKANTFIAKVAKVMAKVSGFCIILFNVLLPFPTMLRSLTAPAMLYASSQLGQWMFLLTLGRYCPERSVLS